MSAGTPISKATYVAEINARLKDNANNKMNISGDDVLKVTDGTLTAFPDVNPDGSNPAGGNPLALGSEVSGLTLEELIKSWTRIFSRVRKVHFTSVECGTAYFRYVRIDSTTPDSTYTAPAESVFNTIEENDAVSWSTYNNIITAMQAVEDANFEQLYATINTCHCSCHSSCHSSRGRR